MKINVSAFFSFFFVGFSAISSTPVNAEAELGVARVNKDVVERLSFDVLLMGKQTEWAVKREGPISVIATDKRGQHKQLVEEAIADINEAFGYGKLALRWKDKVSAPTDDEIVFLLGSVSDGRLLIEMAGVSSPGSFGSGSYRYWYESYSYRRLMKGLVTIDDSLPSELISLLTTKYLLSVLGFRGSSRDLRGTETLFSADHRDKGRQGGRDSTKSLRLTKVDSAMLRFCDRWITPSMTWNELRKVFDRRWSESVSTFQNPAPGKLKDQVSDEAHEKPADALINEKQAASSSDSELLMSREAVLTCDVIGSMGDKKNGTASVRIPKGSKGRIVEQQPHQILLFFWSGQAHVRSIGGNQSSRSDGY